MFVRIFIDIIPLILNFSPVEKLSIEIHIVSLSRDNTKKNKNAISFRRSVEINYGLRNFIGNANKFSIQKIEVKLLSDEKNTEIQISDDGPGFPKDIIDKLGEPYIKSSSKEVKPKIGLGLGTFIGKTLLEKNYGKIN